jgi:peptidoglycan glycosyltransferase
MNRPIRKVSIAIGVLFIALFVNLNWVQVVKGNDYRNDKNNARVLLNEYSSPRGQIVVDGTAIATSVKTKDELKYRREYPEPKRAPDAAAAFAPITGYYSFTYGSTGIEAAENNILTGDDDRLFGTKLADILTGRNPQGGSVDLTLNRAAQLAAYKAMGNRLGSIVALNPSTGAILAAVSTPSFDPNQFASHDSNVISHAYNCYNGPDTQPKAGETAPQLAARIKREIAQREQPESAKNPNGCKGLPNDPTALFAKNPDAVSPLVNKAFDAVYPLGSVFKVIDSAAAFNADSTLTPNTAVPAPNTYWPLAPGRTAACSTQKTAKAGPCIENFDGERCDNGKTATLAFALAKSCNTAFTKLVAEKVGGKALAAEAKKFGLDAPYTGGQPPDFCDPPAFKTPLSVGRSSPGSAADLASPDSLSQTAIGQHDVTVTPLQVAMISAAVANNGTLMQPYLVAKELGPNLSALPQPGPKQLSQVVDPSRSADLIAMMEGVVTSPEGTGGPANITDIPGVQVGGKTGTADHCGSADTSKCPPPHAWFSGFATQGGAPKIAVAVIIDDGGTNGNETTGGLAAGPAAKAVMEAYLRNPGGN